MAKIFDKRTRTWREIEPKAYAEYMKYCTAFRKRQLHHGLCNCNRRMWWLCDTDCLNCEFQCEGDKTVSLDAVGYHEVDPRLSKQMISNQMIFLTFVI